MTTIETNRETTNFIDINKVEDAKQIDLGTTVETVEQSEIRGKDSNCDEKSELINENEVPEEIKKYRKRRKRRIWVGNYGFSESRRIKDKIIKKAESIPTKIEIDEDGSKIIEISLGGKKYKLLDPNLKNHTSKEYKYNSNRVIKGGKDVCVNGQGNKGNDTQLRKNKELASYVNKKQDEGFHIGTRQEIEEILNELGKNRNIYEPNSLESQYDQIACLMYITGIEGRYMLESNNGWRDHFDCFYDSRRFWCFGEAAGFGGNLLMIANN